MLQCIAVIIALSKVREKMKNDLISRSELKRDLQRQFKLVFQEAGQKVNPEDYYIQRKAVYQADLVGAELEAFYAYLDTRPAVDAATVVHGQHCIDIVDFIDWLDVGHLRSAGEKCFSEANVAGMLKDFAITNPVIPATVTRCKDCRYGLPRKLFGRDAITCTKHREEIHPMDWYCADAAKMDGKDDAK